MTFSDAVRRIARGRGLTLTQLGINAGYAKDSELAQRMRHPYPRHQTMERIADALNMKVWEILKYAEETK